MSRYRKKPVVIEAVRMPLGEDDQEVRKVALWMVEQGYDADPDDEGFDGWDPAYVIRDEGGGLIGLPEYGVNYLTIDTLVGERMARLGDYVIRGVQGEFYPVKDSIFRETYEAVDDE